MVSTKIPVSATIRSTIVAKMAMAVRPKSDEAVAGSEGAGEEDSADTVASRRLRWRLS